MNLDHDGLKKALADLHDVLPAEETLHLSCPWVRQRSHCSVREHIGDPDDHHALVDRGPLDLLGALLDLLRGSGWFAVGDLAGDAPSFALIGASDVRFLKSDILGIAADATRRDQLEHEVA